jgi:hypothetical protein
MTLRNLIYVTGVAALIFVLGDLFAAAQLANVLGGNLDAFGVGLVQVRGGVGLLYVFLAYFSRYADDAALQRVVGPTMMWGFVAQFIPILYLILTGVYNASAWIFIVLGIIFISAYVYFLYIRKQTPEAGIKKMNLSS